jgi:regulator of chromosome condensation
VGESNQLGRRLLGRRSHQSITPHLVEVCPKRAKYIASGEFHSFAVDREDNVWAWGSNRFGEAGYARDAGSDSVLLPYPMKIRGLCGRGVILLAGGANHSAAVTAHGQCLVWGRIDGGQLGVQFSEEQLADDTLIKRDERNRPQICLRPTAVPGIGEAAYVACGTVHTIFINKRGEAYGAGMASEGELGIDADEVEVAQRITGEELKERVLTWAGAGGHFSIVAAGRAYPQNKRLLRNARMK